MYNSNMKYKATIGILLIVTLIGSFYLGQGYIQNESLKNAQWLLLKGEGLDLAATNVEITLNFEPSNRISGYSGVNQYGGTYLIKSNK